MPGNRRTGRPYDHCRIGSLENELGAGLNLRIDHCRIGSLETKLPYAPQKRRDHCRIGSLETPFAETYKNTVGSLPHRQLRNFV